MRGAGAGTLSLSSQRVRTHHMHMHMHIHKSHTHTHAHTLKEGSAEEWHHASGIMHHTRLSTYDHSILRPTRRALAAVRGCDVLRAQGETEVRAGAAGCRRPTRRRVACTARALLRRSEPRGGREGGNPSASHTGTPSASHPRRGHHPSPCTPNHPAVRPTSPPTPRRLLRWQSPAGVQVRPPSEPAGEQPVPQPGAGGREHGA